ncbi:MAG: tripartite tricarboxylate transporter substrate binding protein, partial [Burkholderiales bacterium]|nr:tripartite tricarboxylate transporter substrate binding protein [Burkholderiales bacterium]
MIVPFAAGGGADIIGRAVAQKMSEAFGQQVIVDNRPGAAGNIGTELVARAAGDGYTLLIIGPNHATNPFLFRKIPFDPIKDFEPVSLLTSAPYILLVHPSLPVKSVKDLVALARSRPGQINYGSAGNGTAGHLGMELIKVTAKVEMQHVPYKGSPPFVADLIGGQVSAGYDNILSSVPHIRSGRLRAIAVSAGKRTPALPDVPTVAESGMPGYDVSVWQALLTPAGTPKDIVTRLHAEVVAGMQKQDVKDRMAALGVEIIAGTPQQLGAFIKTE